MERPKKKEDGERTRGTVRVKRDWGWGGNESEKGNDVDVCVCV